MEKFTQTLVTGNVIYGKFFFKEGYYCFTINIYARYSKGMQGVAGLQKKGCLQETEKLN